MVWMIQLMNLHEKGDLFNYTDSCFYRCGKPAGKSLVIHETFLLNGRERLSDRDYKYFNYVQSYQNFPYPASEGLNIYSFALYPDKFQPSGTCNMSQIETIRIAMRLSSCINEYNPAKFRGYALVYNVLRIMNGISGLVFNKV